MSLCLCLSEFKELSVLVSVFQSEFTELAANLSDYVVKLLDKVQGNEELNVILNNSDGLEHTPNKTLARLQLAIDYKEKKVRHRGMLLIGFPGVE